MATQLLSQFKVGFIKPESSGNFSFQISSCPGTFWPCLTLGRAAGRALSWAFGGPLAQPFWRRRNFALALVGDVAQKHSVSLFLLPVTGSYQNLLEKLRVAFLRRVCAGRAWRARRVGRLFAWCDHPRALCLRVRIGVLGGCVRYICSLA